MNRILAIVVVVLIPVTIVTSKNNEDKTVVKENYENISLELPIRNTEEIKPEANVSQEEDVKQVLISNESDKSNPFYVNLEEYIVGVVAGEMPASFNIEALKAQAVAARTYATYKMKNIDGYVISTTINDQVYINEDEMKTKWGAEFPIYYEKVKQAVKDTEGELITYNNDVIISYYFAISNGSTENAQDVFNETKDYLVSVDSAWDKEYGVYYSKRVINRNEFCSSLNIACDNIVIGEAIRNENNYVKSISINGVEFTGLQVFNLLGLKSTDFNISVGSEGVVVETYGFGHSVGMSQYGAEAMANKGYNYQDILKHYYKNTEIKKF